ncbi:TBC-domain-containing protein, partial [Lichtheimia hyalospora FSU 10163]
MPPNDDLCLSPPASPSKLAGAWQQREATLGIQQQQPIDPTSSSALNTSKSTPFQHHRRLRTTSFGMGPTPTRAPSMTLHQRRRTASNAGHGSNNKPVSDVRLLPRLEEENANLPPQGSIEFIIAQVERQNAMLDEDPKSVCIQSNELKAHLSTMQNLVTDNNNSEEDIDWEFWTALIDDFGAVATKLPHLLSAKLKAGIPSKLRGVIWQAMSQSASLHLETVYGQLVAEHSPYERIIQRDLARTFPSVEMFKQEGGDGQQALERVLKAYSLYDSHVGYCQGLAFLVGPLLMNMPEQQAFCVFVRLMETYEMRTMFTLNMEGLQLRLYQFSSLLAQILPELSDHLANHSVHAPMYASQWFLTLFAYACPISLVMRIYDIIFAEGAAETIMRIAIAMLKRSQDQLLEMTEFEDILDLVTSKLHLAYSDDASMMINDAMELSGLITREKIDNLAELYLKEVEQEQKQTEQVLAVRFNFWSKQSDNNNNTATSKKKKRESSSWLRKRASSSSSSSTDESSCTTTTTATTATTSATTPPGQDIAMLHQQIEDLLLALSQIQNEHLQVKQELVQIRMDKMDVEAERDALKMTMMGLEQQPDDVATLRSELVKTKESNFELQQQNEELKHQNQMAKEAQTGLIEKMVNMKNKMEQMESDHHKTVRAHEKKLVQIQEQQQRTQRPLMSNRSLSSNEATCSTPTEKRCHELEQLLADAKLHIAELETFGVAKRPTTTVATSSAAQQQMKRRSYDPSKASKRASFYGRFWSSVTTTTPSSQQETPPSSPI